MPSLLIIAGAVRKAFADYFDRSNDSTLGAAWNTIRGSWGISSNQASSSSNAGDYALATAPYGNTNVKATLATSNGCGVAFWVSDAGSWYASVPIMYSANENYNYNYCIASSCCSGSNTCSYSSCCYTTGGTASTCQSNSCCSSTASTCQSNSCCTTLQGPFCVANNCCSKVAITGPYGSHNSCMFGSLDPANECYACVSNSCCSTVAGQCVSNSCCTGSPGSCVASSCCTGSPGTAGTCVASGCCSGSNTCQYDGCCSTGTSSSTRARYYWAVRFIKAVAGVFTTVQTTNIANSLNSSPDLIQSMGLQTVNGVATVTAYSDSALGSVAGTAVYDSGTTQAAAGVGIVKAPSDNNQGSTVDSFTVN